MSNNSTPKKALLYSNSAPDDKQRDRFCAFLDKKYTEGCELVWIESDLYPRGFRLEVGSDVYDFSIDGRFEQFKNALKDGIKEQNISIPLIRDVINNFTAQAIAHEIGTLVTIGDGIAVVEGLKNAFYGEILIFENGIRGMVQNLSLDQAGCILFDDDGELCSGTKVIRTGKMAGIPVGENFIGRVVNSLGSPIDNKGDITASDYYMTEKPAPAIIDRQPVKTPLKTGILAIDSMFPIGRGQRELIIGDRQTGKTTIALDTILNQKGKDVICIYVSIGQKSSSLSKLVHTLEKNGAMDYTIVIHSSASDSAPMQYMAPYAGTAMGEYFMEKGHDVLIVYDDLSKHAVAYRSMSLLLGRSPGREAYPGDIFYLHSRLLERSARLNDKQGGGSMTALPIVETQAGDVAAYIPTNIISITDGQIFLESDLFFAGQRPAVNVGLSVSRVGGDAQTKALKRAAGTLRLELAQYREMKMFTQFSSDLDDETKKQLEFGKGLMNLLCQPQGTPMPQYRQVILITAALGRALTRIPSDKIRTIAYEMLDYFDSKHRALCESIETTGMLSDSERENIIAIAHDFANNR